MRKIILDGNYECTCGGCPTIFEFKDVDGISYYFRLRWGAWRLSNDITNEQYASGISGDCDGMCSWEEAKNMMYAVGVIIVN